MKIIFLGGAETVKGAPSSAMLIAISLSLS